VTRTAANSPAPTAADRDGRTDPRDTYSWLIRPLTPEEFQARCYEREVCHIRRGDPFYFSKLLSIDQLDRVLTTGLAKHPEIQLVQNEKNITANEYRDADDRVDPVRATRLFRQGATIIFTHLHQRLPELGRLCEGLERAFSSKMQTNIYLTPPSAQGFAPHWTRTTCSFSRSQERNAGASMTRRFRCRCADSISIARSTRQAT